MHRLRSQREHHLEQRASIQELATLDSVPAARCRHAKLPSTDGRRRHAERVSDLRVREPKDIARSRRHLDNGPRLAQRHGIGVEWSRADRLRILIVWTHQPSGPVFAAMGNIERQRLAGTGVNGDGACIEGRSDR